MKKFLLIILLLVLASPGHALTISDAKAFMDDGRYLLAVKAFDQILEEKKDDADAFFYRGLCKFNLNDLNNGIDDLMNAIIHDPKYEEQIVNILVNNAITKMPFNRGNASTLINSALEVTPTKNRQFVYSLLNKEVLSKINEMIETKSINRAEQYLSIASEYSSGFNETENRKITELTEKVEKLKTESNGTPIKDLKGLKAKPRITKNTPSPIQAYLMALGSMIEKNWKETDKLVGLDKNLETRILIKIAKNGLIKNFTYEKSSGNKYLDDCAREAIMKSSPLPQLPNGMESYDLGLIFSPRGLK